MNNLTIIGRLTADPKVRTVDVGGTPTLVTNFWIAVDDGHKKDANGNKIGTEFFRITAWRGAAESIGKYRSKGSYMAVAGAVHLYSFVDTKHDNQQVWRMAVPRPTMFEFVGPNGETEKVIANDIPDEVAATPVAPSGSPAPAEIDPPTPEFASVDEPDDLPW